jgi:enoyl-[acyl-carrier protein] reductase/trans-2-enoyl-CoA reductase (NAD+)
MIIEPKIRGFLCTTAHPVGCAASVEEQIRHVQKGGAVSGGPKKALILGCSTGYGLASRIAAAFGSGAGTLGVGFERPSERGRTASPGWYQNAAFDAAAHKAGLYSKTLNGDAFSDEMKAEVIALLKSELGPVDLFVYSLAAPRRTHPVTGVQYRSTLKPIGAPYTNKTLDFNTGVVSEVTLEPASPEEVEHTIQVMGGEDWEMWTDLLLKEGLLAPGAKVLAYSYIGPEVTQAVYRNGTIGAAKDHLEKTAGSLMEKLKPLGGEAYVSVNKALVTQASSAIPFMPLYISLLYKVMKDKGLQEGCIEQIDRLFRERLYTGGAVPTDAEGRVRVDDWEMREDVQSEVKRLWPMVNTENLAQWSDGDGYRDDFLRLFGFNIAGVDYAADVPDDEI